MVVDHLNQLTCTVLVIVAGSLETRGQRRQEKQKEGWVLLIPQEMNSAIANFTRLANCVAQLVVVDDALLVFSLQWTTAEIL